jgi:cerevisin
MMQQTTLDELKMFSQAPGASLLGLSSYAFDSVGGQGITVYVVDTGINQNHQVSVTDF